jgi:hypothetical protein
MEARIAGIAVAESTAHLKPVDIDRARDIARRISSRPLLDPRTPRDMLEQAWAAPAEALTRQLKDGPVSVRPPSSSKA